MSRGIMKSVSILLNRMSLVKHKIVQVQPLPYWPDLFSATFSGFLNWKFIWGVKFEDVEDIKINMTVMFHTIPKEKF